MKIEACGRKATLHPACQKNGAEIPVHDVLFIPHLSTNFLSVVQIVKNGFQVVFQTSGCEIYNTQGKLVATGVVENVLFKLEQLEGVCHRASQAMLSSAIASAETWHKRMGHLNYNSV
ncbi:uncharacterized protein LOC129719773 [Wyeomyia smithii]|uniref:uncharacterized protein LOC129719773 n=1 Tax=Wyeomyia smithii TaxID=174621 RepID=UPI002467F804|nr:uncharacterized protein LOC129719773 [Wyeomyia smithii]